MDILKSFQKFGKLTRGAAGWGCSFFYVLGLRIDVVATELRVNSLTLPLCSPRLICGTRGFGWPERPCKCSPMALWIAYLWRGLEQAIWIAGKNWGVDLRRKTHCRYASESGVLSVARYHVTLWQNMRYLQMLWQSINHAKWSNYVRRTARLEIIQRILGSKDISYLKSAQIWLLRFTLTNVEVIHEDEIRCTAPCTYTKICLCTNASCSSSRIRSRVSKFIRNQYPEDINILRPN